MSSIIQYYFIYTVNFSILFLSVILVGIMSKSGVFLPLVSFRFYFFGQLWFVSRYVSCRHSTLYFDGLHNSTKIFSSSSLRPWDIYGFYGYHRHGLPWREPFWLRTVVGRIGWRTLYYVNIYYKFHRFAISSFQGHRVEVPIIVQRPHIINTFVLNIIHLFRINM